MVGILVSFWDGLFSGAMLVSGRVYPGSPVDQTKNGHLGSSMFGRIPDPTNGQAVWLAAGLPR